MSELHPAILVKDTIEKFGYDPIKLTEGSGKKVIVCCPECKTKKELKRQAVKNNWVCAKCSNIRNAATARARKKEQQFSTIILSDIKILADCVYTYNYRPYTSSRKKAGGKIRGKGLNESLVEAIKTYTGATNPRSDTVKLAAKNKIMELGCVQLFSLVCYILETHRTLFLDSRRDDYCLICDAFIPEILNKLGFKFYDMKAPGKERRIRVTKGSFFLNGRWLHIGN
jgi:hypothetical protein